MLQGVILACILLTIPSGHRRANAFMAALVTCIALTLVQKWMVRSDFLEQYPALALVTIGLRFTWGPLLYLYAYTLTGGQLKLRQLLHFVPAATLVLILNLYYWQFDSDQQAELVNFIWGARTESNHLQGTIEFLPVFWQSFIVLDIYAIGITFHIGFYCLMVIKRIRDHNQRMKRHYSSLEHMNLRWLNALTIACLVYLALLIAARVSTFGSLEQPDMSTFATNPHSLFLVLIIYGIAITAIFQPSLIKGVEESAQSELDWAKPANMEPSQLQVDKAAPDAQPEDRTRKDSGSKYSRSSISMEDAQSFQMRLMSVMQDQELYLDSDLTLPELASAAGLTANQTSQVINMHMSQNFYTFVNNYRIQLAKQLLSDPETARMPIVQLAFEVGFKSKSSFYDAFKRTTELTPTQFKRALENESG